MDEVAYLRTPQAIRERAGNIYAAAGGGKLEHFVVAFGEIDACAAYVAKVTREAYPDLDIPYHSRWNHFRAGGVDRLAGLWADVEGDGDRERDERARRQIELVVTSVLLDAGAGPDWRYREPGTGRAFARSEGLAVASLHMFRAGALDDLAGFDAARLAEGFQVGPDNPLVGLEGRAALVRSLASCAATLPGGRVGGLYDQLRARAEDGRVPAAAILEAVLTAFGSIWPGRIELGGENLGDVWRHRFAGGEGASAGLVPFHKLSQWLSYSIVEPLEWAGLEVTDLDALTGLPEYRNGGLLIDSGVLVPRHPDVTGRAHGPGDEVVVEWRALTVALLDRVAERVRVHLERPDLPLARILEGGTWSAGRRLARERRDGGVPPIQLDSDGTVF